MEIINPLYLYFILQLDSIKDFLSFAAIVPLVLTVAGCIAWFVCTMEASMRSYRSDDYIEKNRAAARLAGRKAFQAMLVGAALSCFNSLLPTSERMAVLVVLPAVANNEALRTEAKEVYDLAKRGLAKLIETEPTDATTEETN